VGLDLRVPSERTKRSCAIGEYHGRRLRPYRAKVLTQRPRVGNPDCAYWREGLPNHGEVSIGSYFVEMTIIGGNGTFLQ